MKVYDLNKAGYAALPTLTPEEEKRAVKKICDYLMQTDYQKYYMMLNHDIHYYTLFNFLTGDKEKLSTEVLDVAKSLGAIKSVELSNNKEMIEIWITNIMTGECYMYGFFGYEKGVIEI